ncbi:hypothetical protein K6U06_01945 [Acidiferrimicrobium sp. IK]|uniref:hypothetical protein n=1 Tax=Acidiferrimicrobium sp. IK TaxID=2871700 RepID=UPI0021CAF0AE|nr:hypothetical protein [Acidiferrimicrobium sp. IK]MCU4183106.1 hypothetical protein [Acidiferrimicrobium sp. IK]
MPPRRHLPSRPHQTPVRELRAYPRPETATPRQVRIGTALLAAWLVLLVGLAVWTGVEVHRLDRQSMLLASTGTTLTDTATGLRRLEHIPVVGAAVAAAARQVGAAGGKATASAATSKAGIDELAWLLGAAIAVIPAAPAVVVLGRFRLARRRERRALMAALADPARRGLAQRHLAGRAGRLLPYRDLAQLPDTSVETLAAAEAARLGLR